MGALRSARPAPTRFLRRAKRAWKTHGSTAFAANWRRGRDSNPRWLLHHTHFPGVLLRPLGHLSQGGDQCQPHPGARIRCCRCSLPGLTGLTTASPRGDRHGHHCLSAAVYQNEVKRSALWRNAHWRTSRIVGGGRGEVARHGLMSMPPRRRKRPSTNRSLAAVARSTSAKIRSTVSSWKPALVR